MILVGSTALGEDSKDVDLILSDSELDIIKYNFGKALYPIAAGKYVGKCLGDNRIYELEIARKNNSAEVLNELLCDSSKIDSVKYFFGLSAIVPTLDVLYMLKMSHRYLRNSPHFQKTRKDILKMRKMGAKMIDSLDWQEWYKQREAETYWYEHPNLKRTKDQFFSGDGVEYIFDHDWLHTQVAFREKPMYTQYQVEGEEVLSSKAKFDQLPHLEKCMAVAEEAMVLALERAIIPNGMKVTKAKTIALEKVCTSITSGWFREFAWENYDPCWKLLKDMKVPESVKR